MTGTLKYDGAKQQDLKLKFYQNCYSQIFNKVM